MLNDYKLLYAEDNDKTRQSMSETFSMMFKEVFPAKDGKQALEIYKEKSPDIIMLDIEMPHTNGLDLAAEIRKEDSNIPIVIITGFRETKYFLQAVELNLTTYILKPIMIEELQRAIKKCIDQLKYLQKKEIIINDFTYYDIKSRQLFVNNEVASLTNMEMRFLEYMLKYPNRVISYEEFENNLWEDGMTSSAIRSLVRDLRSHVSKETIENVPKVGYKLILKK